MRNYTHFSKKKNYQQLKTANKIGEAEKKPYKHCFQYFIFYKWKLDSQASVQDY